MRTKWGHLKDAGWVQPAKGDGTFAHALSRAKQDRARARARRAVADELTAAAVTVIDRPGQGSPAMEIGQLSHDGEPLEVEGHQQCPGHAAYVTAACWPRTPGASPRHAVLDGLHARVVRSSRPTAAESSTR